MRILQLDPVLLIRTLWELPHSHLSTHQASLTSQQLKKYYWRKVSVAMYAIEPPT